MAYHNTGKPIWETEDECVDYCGGALIGFMTGPLFTLLLIVGSVLYMCVGGTMWITTKLIQRGRNRID